MHRKRASERASERAIVHASWCTDSEKSYLLQSSSIVTCPLLERDPHGLQAFAGLSLAKKAFLLCLTLELFRSGTKLRLEFPKSCIPFSFFLP